MQKKIQINLLPATDREKSLELDLLQELHLMLVGLPDTNRKIIFNAIREQLLAMPDTDVRKLDLSETIAESQAKSIFQELVNRYNSMAELGLRTIEEYNTTSANNWHYIVVLINYHPVVNEDDCKIDDLICKLAQKGRAAGIHLILESSITPPFQICFNFPARFIGNSTLEMAEGECLSENEFGLFYSYCEKCERRTLH